MVDTGRELIACFEFLHATTTTTNSVLVVQREKESISAECLDLDNERFRILTSDDAVV